MINRCPKATQLSLIYTNYRNSVLGGTFDHLHIAHKGLITLALEIAERTHIGVMEDEWVKGKEENNKVQRFSERVDALKSYLREIGMEDKAHIVPLSDPYSYALEGEEAKKLDSIVISSEKGVLNRTIELNEMRKSRRLDPLDIIKMPLVVDWHGKTISSTRIRKGELKLNYLNIKYTFTNEQLETLKTPKGEFYKSLDEVPYFSDCVIAVGDIVTKTMIEGGFPISISVIDRKSRRVGIDKMPLIAKEGSERGEINVPIYLPTVNRKSTISHQSWFVTLLSFFQQDPVVIRVYGEEDLMGFPTTILAPEGAQVIYGDPFRNGIVVIDVDYEKKVDAMEFLKGGRIE